MNKTNLIFKSAVLAGMLLLPSCVVNHGEFTVLSNKLIRESEFAVSQAERATDVVGQDVQHIVFIFPIGGAPLLEYAIDNGLEKGGGDVFTNATVKIWSWYIPYIYGQVAWQVTGDVVKTRRN